MTDTSIPLPKNSKFLVAGDWHASYYQAETAIKYALENDIDTIIHVGDFGFYEHCNGYLKLTDNAAKRANLHIYSIQGNHEEFPYLYSKPLDPTTGLRPVRSNIIHLPQNTRWSWEDISFLALGGAASIDFQSRKPGISWWPEEQLTDEDIQTAQNDGHANVMFTHDCPSTLPNPITADPMGQANAVRFFSAQGLRYSNQHQERLAEVTNVVKPEVLFHGHFHVAHQRIYTHQDGTHAYGIGLNQGGSPSNYRIIDLSDLRNLITYVQDKNNETESTP